MKNSWILIANSERARCFERHTPSHELTELQDFIHPARHLAEVAEGGDLTGAAGKGHGRTGHAGTQFEPHTEDHAKERSLFARQLADYLNSAVGEHRCPSFVLIASSPMLGVIKPLLSSAAEKAFKCSIVSDLTQYTGPELKARVDHALALPD